MSAQIVFLTIFLGLTAGRQSIRFDVAGNVAELRLFSGDRELARRTSSPWQLDVDLGPLRPQRLRSHGANKSSTCRVPWPR